MNQRTVWMALLVTAVCSTDLAIADLSGVVGPEFTYQGELTESGSPVDGPYDFEFFLFDAANGGVQLAPSVLIDDWSVSDGIFTVNLDFGSVFNSADAAWLEIHVREGASGGSYTVLTPRQPLTATPYALTATSVLPNTIGTDEIISSQVQRRVGGACPPQSFITNVLENGMVNCGSGLDASYWQAGAVNSIFYDQGDVGIQTDTPAFDLHVDGTAFVNSSMGRLVIGYPDDGDQWNFSTLSGGSTLQLSSKPMGSNIQTGRMYFDATTGHAAIGANPLPDEELVVGENLGSGWTIPAITVGGSDGGAIQAGNADYKISMENSNIFLRARIIATSPSGFGQGEVEMLTNGLSIGEDAGSPGAFMLKVTHGSFGFNLARASSDNNWELVTSLTADADLVLFGNGLFLGAFSGTDGSYAPASDRRLKTDTEPLEPVLDRVLRLSPYRYRMTGARPQSRQSIGFIAQDVEPLFPELVNTIDDDRVSALTLNYSGFGVLAIQAVKEQQEKIVELEDTISSLEARLAALENQLGN